MSNPTSKVISCICLLMLRIIYPVVFLASFAASFIDYTPTQQYQYHASRINNYHSYCNQKQDDTSAHNMNMNNYKHCKTTILSMSSRSRNQQEDIYGAVHRKEYEMKRLNAQHASLSDPVRMASKCSLTSFRLF